MSNIKAVIFDLDGTLVKSFTTTPLPGIAERIAKLRADGVPIAICTNQAGPLWRAHTRDTKYPSTHHIKANIVEIIRSLGLGGVYWFISAGDNRVLQAMGGNAYERATMEIVNDLRTQDVSVSVADDWRKPAPGMLLAAAKYLDVKPQRCLYVGDMQTDRQAAEAAGMQFEMAQI